MNISLALESLAPLLEYPGEDYHALSEACAASLNTDDADTIAAQPAVGGHLSKFAEHVRTLTRDQLEELYTRTFDLNPTCSLDIGWHLYGEQYTRGAFLVSLRAAHRAHGVDEETELPDHLPSVLRLLARSGETEARDLTGESLLPAVEKMLSAFSNDQNPYSSLLRAVDGCLHMICPLVTGGTDHD